MRKFFLFVVLCTLATISHAQLLTWSPAFPNDNSNLEIIVDCSRGNRGLFNFSNPNEVYVHTGVTTNLSGSGGSEWRYVNGTTGGQWGGTTPALKAESLGSNRYRFRINNVRAFYNVPAGETITNVAILFRSANANAAAVIKQANSDGSDMYIRIFPSGTQGVRLFRPFEEPRFVPFVEPITASVGTQVPAAAVASTNTGTLTMFFNGTQIAGPVTNRDTIEATPTVSVAGNQEIVARLTVGSNTFSDTTRFFVAPQTVVAPLPTGLKEGINYYPNCADSVTLVLFAPGKNNVMVIGEFPGSNWLPQNQYQMFRTPDGNNFWLTVKNLTPGTEYAYQYIVDNTIYIADPRCEKILDPFNDPFISSATYPNLKPYPTNSNVVPSRNFYLSVLQICEPQYNWAVPNFTKPDPRNLLIYELLPRDFTNERNFQKIIDTIPYLKRLGINAVEFMPLQEFSGNESWGYNPVFYFAPDKFYGTKNKLKELIDSLHSNGMAVLLDVVYNQLDAFNAPQGRMYWDATNNRPATNNPWLNPTARHPFNVFEDFNHESAATQQLVTESAEHWLREYKIDGFRFDLSKGFTQRQTNDVGAWNAFDQSRIDNLNRYYDYLAPRFPGSYLILEHFGIPSEENVLIQKGFMTWRKMTDEYNESTMGQTGNKNIGDIMWNYTVNGRQAPSPALVGFMESHDEERLMFKNLQFGANSGGYNVRDTATALRRMEAAGSVFFTVPGPKMLWQFGETGYEVSIFACPDGVVPPATADDPNRERCKLSNKPIRWNYMNQPNRRALYDAWSKMIAFRMANPSIFNNAPTNWEPNSNSGFVKVLQIGQTAIAGTQVTIIANLGVTNQTKAVTFQKTGNWYNLISNATTGTGSTTAGLNGVTGSTFEITTTSQTINLGPGEYHIYVSCSTPLPTVSTPITYCVGSPATPLTATGGNLLWYTTATGGTGSPNPPTPSTATAGTQTFYVTQTIECESQRAAIVVNVTATTPAPSVTTPLNLCQGATASPLTATGTSLLWYAAATGGTGSSTAPTPSTAAVGSNTFYVSQTLSCGEGPRAAIVVNVNAIPAAPGVSNPAPVCQGSTAVALTASGSNLLWYTAATGGTGSATAPTPSTANAGSTSFFVSQTVNGCESPRATIAVTVNATPAAPGVSNPSAICQNAPASPLTATGTNLLWYTAATGGTGSATAPTPSTANAGNTSFFVSQTVNGCESPRATITVTVIALPPAPSVTSPVVYCQNAPTVALTATGVGLQWFNVATGGTGSSIAPTPSAATAGSTTFFVAQQVGSCDPGPRAAIVVNVTATPGLATGLSASNITLNSASINWNAIAGQFYFVDYRAVGAPNWISVVNGVATGSAALTGLSSSTTYEFRVATNCANSLVANYATATFSTISHNSTINDGRGGFGLKITPNPVRGSALLDYIVPGNGPVNISLVSANGQLIQRLFTAVQPAGQYQLQLPRELAGLPAGVYVIRIEQNGKGHYEKVVVQ
jgi:glycosidase